MPIARNPLLLGLAAAAALMSSTAGADNIVAGSEALTSAKYVEVMDTPADLGGRGYCDNYSMNANSTLYGATTCGMGNHVGQYGSCAGQWARGEDASIEVIVTEHMVYSVWLDPNEDWLSAFLIAWGPCSDPEGCPENLDKNDVIDSDDLFAVLANWGPCP